MDFSSLHTLFGCFASTNPLWLSHVNILSQLPIKESGLDIHLPNLIIMKCRQWLAYSNRLYLRNWWEGLIIVNSGSLSKALRNQSRLICVYFPSTSVFFLKIHLHPTSYVRAHYQPNSKLGCHTWIGSPYPSASFHFADSGPAMASL